MEIIKKYIEAWNTTDAAARRELIAEVWAEDGAYTDPLADVVGREQLDAIIAAVQGQFAGLAFSIGGEIDAHHEIARFTWHLGPEGGDPLVIGFDVAVLENGQIRQILGFLDKVPT